MSVNHLTERCSRRAMRAADANRYAALTLTAVWVLAFLSADQPDERVA